MQKSISVMLVLMLIVLPSLSCHKKKPTQSNPQAFAVSLRVVNYSWRYCMRLMIGTNPINQCGLGESSNPIWAGDYDCRLYAVTDPGPAEILALVATSTLHLDRNFTCVVDGGSVHWIYWQ